MADPLLKAHGATAYGLLVRHADGYRATLVVRDNEKGLEQKRGPESFKSDSNAARWLYSEASKHGFGPEDFDLIEDDDDA